MATVQMPDGALVELPDDPNDDEKEKIRQVIEASRAKQQQTSVPAASRETPGVEIKSGYVGRGEFAPEAGAESAPIVTAQPQDPLAQVTRGMVGAVGAMIPKSLGDVMQMLTVPRGSDFEGQMRESEELGKAWRGEYGLEQQAQAITGTALQAAPMLHLPFAESPLRATPKDLSLVKAFRTLQEKPESPTPLSDAVTKEVENATQTGQIAESIQPERTGDETRGTPAGPITGGGVQPATQVPLETRESIAARGGIEGRTSELPALEVSPESAAAIDEIAIPEAAATAPIAEKPIEQGFVRLYHGSSTDAPQAGRDFTTSRQYAEDYAAKAEGTGEGKVWSVDVPEGSLKTHDEYGQPMTRVIVPDEIANQAKPISPVSPRLLPGETQGDLLSSTQQEPLALVGEKGVDYEAIQKAEETAKAARAESEKGQMEFGEKALSPAAQKVWDSARAAKDEFTGTDASHLTPSERRELAQRGLSFTVDRKNRALATYPQRLRVEDLRQKVTGTASDIAQELTKEEEARLKDEYEKGLLADVEEHQQRGGDEILDAIKSLGGLRIDEPHFGDLKEAFYKKAGFSKLASGEEGYRYKDIFQKNAPGGDALVQALRAKGFDVENPGHLADILDRRFKTGKKVFGIEARAQEGDITGLGGYAMGAAGTREIPIRGWKEMLESGERTPVETTDSIERAKGEIGKAVDIIGGAFRNLKDFITVNPVPKLTRAGISDAAYEHASARNSVVHQVRHLLSRVFPDDYKNPAAMQRTGDILTKDNILGVYDQAKERLDAAETATPEYDAAAEAVNKIEESHNLAAYDRDVTEAVNDPKIAKNIKNWKTFVNPEMDRMYNEIKSLDPWTLQEPRGRHFGARINLLPLDQAADLAKFTDANHAMPDLVTSNYRNPNVKRDPFMRRATGTGQYSTDPGLILTNSLARRYNEVTKLRFYNAVEKSGNGFITDPGVRTDVTNIVGEDLTRLAIKTPETNPKTGMTRPVEKSLWIKKSLAREARDVLNTDMGAPNNPVFRAITQVQLLQLADATAHMKNIHTILANSLGASKPWQDAVRKLPFLSTADTVGRIASVVREVASDSPAIRDEISQMAKRGMIRPKYPSTGVQKITKMQNAIHHVDTAARIVMNRFWDNLAERGMVTDTPAARRQFVQQIGEYNSRLMGSFSRTLRNYGASPFIVAGRTFNAFSKRLLLGDPGFKAASPQAAALARAYQLTGLTLATTVPAIINYAITGNFGGRPGTPIGAIDTGMNNEKGDKKIIDVFQLMGIRRGLRATGVGAVIEGLREGKSFNEIGGKAVEDITTTASHPWIGPGLGAIYSGISGKRLDLRGGAWPYAAKQVKEGGLKQYGENLRVTLKNQNPLLYGLVSPLVGETEDTYTQGLARGLLKAPASAVGYVEKPGQSAFQPKREKSKVKVKP